MPKKKKTEQRPGEQAASSEATDSKQQMRRTRLLVASAVTALILIIIGVGYYLNYVAPFRINVIVVDGIPIRMDYLIKRTRLADANPMDMLPALINEQLIKIQAPKYGIEVNTEDIDRQLMSIARGQSANITESELKEWYRQQLNESGLSDSEYKELVTVGLLAARLQEVLAERVPTVAEQVHLNAIMTETGDDAQNIKTRLEAGEDFADLARELSTDKVSAENNGDIDWFPRGILGSAIDNLIFNLNIGDVSQPVPFNDNFSLFMVSEKANARELDEYSLQALRGMALDDWLLEEMRSHEVKYNGLSNGFDSETLAWINWQLAKK